MTNLDKTRKEHAGTNKVWEVGSDQQDRNKNGTPGCQRWDQRNEQCKIQKRIKEKIENSLLQDYPKDRLEIIVASDCSSDRTDEIVRSYGEEIKLIRAPERKGKENAQKYAVEAATGEIFVFSDVATILEPNSISKMDLE